MTDTTVLEVASPEWRRYSAIASTSSSRVSSTSRCRPAARASPLRCSSNSEVAAYNANPYSTSWWAREIAECGDG